MAGLLKLHYIEIPNTEVLLSEDGSYTYIQTDLHRSNCTPFVFHSTTRAGWVFSFVSSATMPEWRLIIKGPDGGVANGSFNGLLFYVGRS